MVFRVNILGMHRENMRRQILPARILPIEIYVKATCGVQFIPIFMGSITKSVGFGIAVITPADGVE